MLEREIQASWVRKLRKEGWIVTRLLANTGWPDIVAFRDGKTYFVEFKAPSKKPTQLQMYFIDLLRTNGFRVDVFDNKPSKLSKTIY